MESDKTLKKRTLYGLIWSFSELVANQGINLLVLILLARILSPEDFGIIGMLAIFIAISQEIIDSGFTNALIREKKNSQKDLSTVFYFNLIVAAVLYITLFFSAEIISKFFEEPLITSIIKVLAIVLIINSIGIIQKTILVKKLDFKTLTKITITSSVISGIIAIIFAVLGYGIWSLVIKTLTMQFIQSFLLIIHNKWKPSLVFSIESFKRLFGFGWKLLIAGLISTAYQNIYYVVIGKSYSAVELGYYTNANKLRDAPARSITTAIRNVTYPAMSSIKENQKKLSSSYKKTIKLSVFIMFPIMIGLVAIAPSLIEVTFGEKWLESIPYFQILCFAGLLLPLQDLNLNILKVKGRSDLILYLEILKKFIGLISIFIIVYFQFGILILLWSMVINAIVFYLINSFFSGKEIHYSTFEQIKDIAPTLLVSLTMGIIVKYSGTLLLVDAKLVLLVQVIIGIVSYYTLCKVIKIKELYIAIELLQSIIKKNK